MNRLKNQNLGSWTRKAIIPLGIKSKIRSFPTYDVLEITTAFDSFPPSHSAVSFPCSPSLPGPLFLILSCTDGSITGATLRELLQPSLSGCVSSNVRALLSNLLTMQEKGERMMGGKKISSPQMMPAGSHRALNFAGWFSLFSALWPPDSDLQTEPYWAFLHGRAQAAALSRKEKKEKRWQRNKEISTNTWEKLFSLQMLD